MERQVLALASDLRELVPRLTDQIEELFAAWDSRSARRLFLTGAGDSHHASICARMAFEQCPSIASSTAPVQELLGYGPTLGREADADVIIATSASGSSPLVVRAVESARSAGASTIAVTGRAGSPLAEAAEHTILVGLQDSERSPGIRTYQASLLGLLLIALRLAEARAMSAEEATRRWREIKGLADVLDATVENLRPRCLQLAEAIADARVIITTGTGPSNGTAKFAAAKIVEGTALLAVGQDLEEWWHVERFARPFDMPLFVIAPPGRSRWRAVQLASAARDLGRRVITVQHEDDTELARHAHTVLPVAGDVHEELSGVLYHVFAGLTSSHLAEHLGRVPFQDTNRSESP